MTIRIGTAGWAIARDVSEQFPAEGSSLERYASRFTVAEINSSFHREHRTSTWQRWRDSVPASFRFSVKLPKTITHQAKLRDCDDLLDDFAEQVRNLGDKLAVILVQLPPKLELDMLSASQLFEGLAQRCSAMLACEPRNTTWFTAEADDFLRELRVARVAADPALLPSAARPGGWTSLQYWRLHGSPRMYRSTYRDRIDQLASAITSEAKGRSETWCIFDNTASSAATGDALALCSAISADV